MMPSTLSNSAIVASAIHACRYLLFLARPIRSSDCLFLSDFGLADFSLVFVAGLCFAISPLPIVYMRRSMKDMIISGHNTARLPTVALYTPFENNLDDQMDGKRRRIQGFPTYRGVPDTAMLKANSCVAWQSGKIEVLCTGRQDTGHRFRLVQNCSEPPKVR